MIGIANPQRDKDGPGPRQFNFGLGLVAGIGAQFVVEPDKFGVRGPLYTTAQPAQ